MIDYEEYFFRLEETDEGFEDLDEEKIIYEFREIEFPKTAKVFLNKYGCGYIMRPSSLKGRPPKWETFLHDCVAFSKIRKEIVFSIEVFEMKDAIPGFTKHYFKDGMYSKHECEYKYPEYYEVPNECFQTLEEE